MPKSVKPDWLEFAIANVRSDFDGLNVDEIGACMKLLFPSFDQSPACSIPGDDAWVANACGLPIDRYVLGYKRGVNAVYKLGEDGRHHWALMRQAWDKAVCSIRSSQSNGSLGAQKRWGKRKKNRPPNSPPMAPLMGGPIVSVSVPVSQNSENSEGNKTAPRRAREAEPLDLPQCLHTAAFETAWHEWQRYRAEAKKPLTPSTVRKQLRVLERMGHDGAIASIEQSIANGWQGLFEPRTSGSQLTFAQQAGRDRARQRSTARGDYAEPDAPLPRL